MHTRRTRARCRREPPGRDQVLLHANGKAETDERHREPAERPSSRIPRRDERENAAGLERDAQDIGPHRHGETGDHRRCRRERDRRPSRDRSAGIARRQAIDQAKQSDKARQRDQSTCDKRDRRGVRPQQMRGQTHNPDKPEIKRRLDQDERIAMVERTIQRARSPIKLKRGRVDPRRLEVLGIVPVEPDPRVIRLIRTGREEQTPQREPEP